MKVKDQDLCSKFDGLLVCVFVTKELRYMELELPDLYDLADNYKYSFLASVVAALSALVGQLAVEHIAHVVALPELRCTEYYLIAKS